MAKRARENVLIMQTNAFQIMVSNLMDWLLRSRPTDWPGFSQEICHLVHLDTDQECDCPPPERVATSFQDPHVMEELAGHYFYALQTNRRRTCHDGLCVHMESLLDILTQVSCMLEAGDMLNGEQVAEDMDQQETRTTTTLSGNRVHAPLTLDQWKQNQVFLRACHLTLCCMMCEMAQTTSDEHEWSRPLLNELCNVLLHPIQWEPGFPEHTEQGMHWFSQEERLQRHPNPILHQLLMGVLALREHATSVQQILTRTLMESLDVGRLMGVALVSHH